jgi:hypothetical protein
MGRVPARTMSMQHRALNAQAVDPKGRYYPVRVRILKSQGSDRQILGSVLCEAGLR